MHFRACYRHLEVNLILPCCAGTRSLVDSCLSAITTCEAQMSRLPHLNIPPKLRGQVLEAYQAELNSPPPTTVTFTRTNAYQ